MTKSAWKGIVLAVLAMPGVCLAVPFEIVIQRNLSCNSGEAGGALYVAGQEVARTLELPWRDNQAQVSRVPAGSYQAKIRADGALRWRVELRDVPNRTHVQLHVGNYPRQTEGCVLVGEDVSSSNGTCSLKNSAKAMEALKEAMDQASDDGISSQPLEIRVTIRD